jgi:hypothetical protein
MNIELFNLVAKFSVRARKNVGNIKVQEFMRNPAYRNTIIEMMDEDEDPALKQLAVLLGEKLSS